MKSSTKKNILIIISVVLLIVVSFFFIRDNKSFEYNIKEVDKNISWSANVTRVSIHISKNDFQYISKQKKESVLATSSVWDSNGKLLHSSNKDFLKTRGSSTFVVPKKGYMLELDEPANLCNHTSCSKYVLISNIYDFSYFKNKFVYDMALALNGEWAPAANFAELYINGDYQGLYLLAEKIDLTNMGLSSDNAFLCQLRNSEQTPYTTTANHPIRVEEYGDAYNELTPIFEIIQNAENSITSKKGIDKNTGKSFTELLDLESWARKYLIDELMRNNDSNYRSTFLYYHGNGNNHLYLGPAWDYDLCFSKSYHLDSNGLYIFTNKKNSWAQYLYRKKAYRDLVISLYKKEYLPYVQNVIDSKLLQKEERLISAAIKKDRKYWAELKENLAEKHVTTVGYSYVVTDAKSLEYFISKRIDFLNSEWLDGEVPTDNITRKAIPGTTKASIQSFKLGIILAFSILLLVIGFILTPFVDKRSKK